MSKEKNLTNLINELKSIKYNSPNLEYMNQIFRDYHTVIENIFKEEGQAGIISNFYSIHAEAYDKRSHEFCVNYEENFNKLLGVDGVLFYSDEG